MAPTAPTTGAGVIVAMAAVVTAPMAAIIAMNPTRAIVVMVVTAATAVMAAMAVMAGKNRRCQTWETENRGFNPMRGSGSRCRAGSVIERPPRGKLIRRAM